MHLFSNRVTSAAALTLALALSASHANAEKATFTLPFEAHWGTAILPAGEYTMEAPSIGSILPVFTITGNGKTVMLPPSTTDYVNKSERNCLELVNIGGAYFVEKFDSGATGKKFDFWIPKSARHQAMANAQGTVAVINTASK